MWLSDYFLKKYVENQQLEYQSNPPKLEEEPKSVDYKTAKVHEMVMDHNKKTANKSYINFLIEQKSVVTKENTHSQGKTATLK